MYGQTRQWLGGGGNDHPSARGCWSPGVASAPVGVSSFAGWGSSTGRWPSDAGRLGVPQEGAGLPQGGGGGDLQRRTQEAEAGPSPHRYDLSPNRWNAEGPALPRWGWAARNSGLRPGCRGQTGDFRAEGSRAGLAASPQVPSGPPRRGRITVLDPDLLPDWGPARPLPPVLNWQIRAEQAERDLDEARRLLKQRDGECELLRQGPASVGCGL